MTRETVVRAIAVFQLAGICEIWGGYMLWVAIKDKQPLWVGVFGAILLVAYGVIATIQPTGFGRTYAAYGGIFVILALLGGWKVDEIKPDLYDVIGAAIIMAGTIDLFFAPEQLKYK